MWEKTIWLGMNELGFYACESIAYQPRIKFQNSSSYLLEVAGTEALVNSRTFSGNGTGVSNIATKNRFCAYDRLAC
jgi:hypothetical protein